MRAPRGTIEVFSRGMKQKLAFAGAMIHDPKLLILDEPMTGLDVAMGRTIKDLMLEFTAMNRTVILTTHMLKVAHKLATRIAVIDHGRLIAQGSLEELQQLTSESGDLETVFHRADLARRADCYATRARDERACPVILLPQLWMLVADDLR